LSLGDELQVVFVTLQFQSDGLEEGGMPLYIRVVWVALRFFRFLVYAHWQKYSVFQRDGAGERGLVGPMFID